MSENSAMAISLGILGALATFLFGAYGGSLSLWAGFIAWACFFHSGGGLGAAKLTFASTIFGCVLGWLTMLAMTGSSFSAALGGPLWGAICVACSAPIGVLAARFQILSAVPITMSSLACISAFVLLKGNDMQDAVGPANMLTMSIDQNALLNISLSMLIGLGFGLLTEQLAGLLMKTEEEHLS